MMTASKNGGFTLIETAISLLVLALMIPPALEAYSQNRKTAATRLTTERAGAAVQGLSLYYKMSGRLPCPAPLSSPYLSHDDGYETDCRDQSTLAGICSGGVCIEQSVGPQNVLRIRRGAIPYNVLNMTPQDTYDGYGSRLNYAVIENLAVKSSSSYAGSGISLREGTELEYPVTDETTQVQFIIFSNGPDRAGGFDKTGNQIVACAGAGQDRKNCTQKPQAVYHTGPYALQRGTFYYDDFLLYHAVPISEAATNSGLSAYASPVTARAAFICGDDEFFTGFTPEGQPVCGAIKKQQ